ncbi:MAG: hypothetical protein RLZ62_528, partial [Bacteroidota bacterium]
MGKSAKKNLKCALCNGYQFPDKYGKKYFFEKI